MWKYYNSNGRPYNGKSTFLADRVSGSHCGSCHKSCLWQLGVLTVRRTVIHYAHAASPSYPFAIAKANLMLAPTVYLCVGNFLLEFFVRDFLKGARGELLLRSSPRIYSFILSRQYGHIGEHVFQKDAISRGGIIDQNVCHSSHQLTILYDGRT